MQVASTNASFHYADLPIATYRADEVVLAAGSGTGRLLKLKEGVVEVVRQGTQIALVDEPGAVFGEISRFTRSATHGRRTCLETLAVLYCRRLPTLNSTQPRSFMLRGCLASALTPDSGTRRYIAGAIVFHLLGEAGHWLQKVAF